MKIPRLFAAPVAVLLLAACAGSPSGGDEVTPDEATATATAMAEDSSDAMASDESTDEAMEDDSMDDEAMEDDATDADNAFAFTADTVDGGTFDGLSIDDTDVVLWFWAPWCPTCQLQSKTINEALPQMPDGVQFVGVAGLSDDLGYMQEFVEVTGVDGMTHIADLDGDVYRRFDITQQSTLLFINDTGDATLLGSGATADEIVAEAQGLAAN